MTRSSPSTRASSAGPERLPRQNDRPVEGTSHEGQRLETVGDERRLAQAAVSGPVAGVLRQHRPPSQTRHRLGPVRPIERLPGVAVKDDDGAAGRTACGFNEQAPVIGVGGRPHRDSEPVRLGLELLERDSRGQVDQPILKDRGEDGSARDKYDPDRERNHRGSRESTNGIGADHARGG